MTRMVSQNDVTPKEVVRRLSAVYGYPAWRPHGDPMAELVLTVLSQNTSDANSGVAFARLLARFPSWSSLLSAGVEEIESAIQIGGLARIKAPRLLSILEAGVGQSGLVRPIVPRRDADGGGQGVAPSAAGSRTKNGGLRSSLFVWSAGPSRRHPCVSGGAQIEDGAAQGECGRSA